MTNDLHFLLAVTDKGEYLKVGRRGVYQRPWAEAIESWDRLDRIRRAGHLPGIAHLMVRNVEDPDPRWRYAEHREEARMRPMRRTKASSLENAGRLLGAEWGFTGRQGGWIYNDRGECQVQGWWSFASAMRRNGRIREYDGSWWIHTNFVVPEIEVAS